MLFLSTVWWHHRAHIVAGGFPAVGAAVDVVVLAALLHRGEFFTTNHKRHTVQAVEEADHHEWSPRRGQTWAHDFLQL